jgi:hypothetical protein
MMVKKQVQDIARIEILLGVKSDIDKMYPDNRVIIKLKLRIHDNLLLVPCNKPLLEWLSITLSPTV